MVLVIYHYKKANKVADSFAIVKDMKVTYPHLHLNKHQDYSNEIGKVHNLRICQTIC